MGQLRLALFSLDPTIIFTPTNALFQRAIAICADVGADLVVLPETTFSGYLPSEGLKWARCHEELASVEIMNLCRLHNISILYGTWHVHRKGQLGNVARLHTPGRDSYQQVTKRNLFPLEQEDAFANIVKTKRDVVLDSSLLLRIAVCYDLRFANVYAEYESYPEVFLTIANWPESRASHWRALHKARAIENQGFSIGVNRSGKGVNGVTFLGDSIVVDPWGEERRLFEVAPNVHYCEIDTLEATTLRNDFPLRIR